MRRVSSAVAAVAAVLLLAGWDTASTRVQHAAVSLGSHEGHTFVVDVWRDPSNGETAFRFQGESDDDVLRGRTLASVSEGKLVDTTVYSTSSAAWKIVDARFGLTASRTHQALAAGDLVDRPALMTLPTADTSGGDYVFVRDFGTDLAALRHAARFAVPSPGRRLDGLKLADASLDRWLSGDPGYVADITYANSLRSGSDQILLNIALPSTTVGSSYASLYGQSRERITGPGYEARRTSDGDLILRYHGSYVLVRIDGSQTDARIRSILQRIARS
jgi:hypothetical protein